MCTGGENGIANEAIVLHFLLMFPEQRILYRFMHRNSENGCFTLGSEVRCTLLDMSKAFDMVDHGHLFDLLLQRKRPYLLIRFLIQWYSQ